MRILIALAATFGIALTLAAAVPAQHPLLGKWTWTRSVNNCTEVYEYRADGTFDVVSGEEVASGTFEISSKPDSKGFYTFTGRTLKTNGKKDCSDSAVPMPADQKPYTNYIVFHRTEPMHIVCYQPVLEQCFGPLRRTQ